MAGTAKYEMTSEKLFEIQSAMLCDGLKREFVSEAGVLAQSSQNLFALMEMWLEEKDRGRRKSIATILVDEIADYKEDSEHLICDLKCRRYGCFNREKRARSLVAEGKRLSYR